MGKEQAFIWNEECQKVFEKLKQHLISSPILIYPNFEKPFLLYTDTSSFKLGAVLAQKDNDNKEHVVAYASRRTSIYERNYYAIELECLDIV